MTKKQKKALRRIIIAATGLILVNLLARFIFIAGIPFSKIFYGVPCLVIYLVIYFIIGGDILRKAGHGIINRQLFDENFLMAIATLDAFALAIYEKSGDRGKRAYLCACT